MPFPVMAALAGAQALYGIYQSERARKQAEAMKEPGGYEITPEQRTAYERAQEMAKSGYTPEERGQFMQNIAQQQNLGYQRAMRGAQGNQWAGAVLAGVQAPKYGAMADFAARDAALRRQNIRYADQLGADISAQRNRETSRAQSEYSLLQQAYGQARKQGIQNVMNAAWMVGSYMNPKGLKTDFTSGTGYAYSPPPFGTTMSPSGDSYYSPDMTPIP
jgi:hypothetical protein